MDADALITKRLHISGLTPAITSVDLSRRLATFGTVKDLDGLGKLDALGEPKKFGYVTLEGTKAQLARCVNVLSGSTWKGTKLRIGDAKPDYKERVAKELDADSEPPRKKRKRAGGTEAPDMTLVTPSNVADRKGWKVTTMGRMVRPVRMRPEHPLPPLAESALRRNLKKATVPGKKNAGVKEGKEKKQRNRAPDVRARRRTIDPTRWDSVQLKGMFLDVITAPRDGAEEKEEEVAVGAASADDSTSDDSDNEESKENGAEVLAAVTPTPPALVMAISPALESPLVSDAPSPKATLTVPASDPDITGVMDLLAEKQSSLSLLHSLFSNEDDWVGRESVGSDISDDEVDRLKSEGIGIGIVEGEEVEEVPMEIDGAIPTQKGNSIGEDEMEMEDGSETTAGEPIVEEIKTKPQVTLKDLFAPREEQGFSLLGHLDLDFDFDDEMDIPDFTHALPEPSVAIPTTFTIPTLTNSSRTTQFTYDPTLPLFFPLPSTLSRPLSLSLSLSQPQNQNQNHTRLKDNFLALLPEAAAFHRTETEQEIRTRWEETKGELTKEWKRRFREAGKSRRRRGGGDGD